MTDSEPVPGPPEPSVVHRDHDHRDHHDHPDRAVHGRRRLRSALRPGFSRGHLLAGLLCAVLGFALVTQVRQTEASTIGALRQDELITLLQKVTAESDRLDEQARDLDARLADLRTGTDRAAVAEKVARDQLDVYGVLAGTRRAQGPGIELTVQDPSGAVDAALMVDVVQELRGAGAEAMQIGGERIVATTAFTDHPQGQGLLIGDRPVSPPYVVLAIGEAASLHRALAIPGGALETLDSRRASGRVEERATITVSALRPVPSAGVARPAEQATP